MRRLSLCSLALFAVMAVGDQPPVMDPGPKSPQESLRCIKTRPGFTVELMAAEPVVQDPIAFAWGPDGKFWVVEMGDYPLGTDGKGKPGGRVKLLQKSKADGPYDKATVFLDNLGYPTGVFPYGKGVLVTCAPDILYAEDTDGDGKADRKEVLYTGFAEGNQQHRVNGLVWGLDNWIYGANGDSGGKVRAVKSKNVVDIRGRDFRIQPWTGEIEAQTGQTQFGRARDDWGNWFGNNNSNPLFHFVLDDRYLRRNPRVIPPDPRVPVSVRPGPAPVYPISKPLPRFNSPQALNHFTSACSAIIYRDTLFGPAFANNTFVSEPVHNLIHREVMTPNGVTFSSRRGDDEQTSEFLASSDNWFRPTMIQTGPDGALWVADMYRYVIEHPEWIPKDWQAKLDLRAGHDKGRIYRIYPTGKTPRLIPRLDTMTTKDLVACLESPNGWTRDMAQQVLTGPDPDNRRRDAVPFLRALLKEQGKPLAHAHALYVLEALEELQLDEIAAALRDQHPGVRRHAVRVWEDYRSVREATDALPALVKDPDPHVRLQLAYSLGEVIYRVSGETLGKLLAQEMDDRYIRTAALSSVHEKNWKYVWPALVEAKTIPLEALPSLLRMAQAYGTPADVAQLTLLRITAPSGQPGADLYRQMAEILDVLESANTPLAGFLKETGDAPGREAAERLRAIHAAARAALASPKAPVPDRVQAARLLNRGLGSDRDDQKLIASLLTPQTPDNVQAAVIRALSRGNDPRVPGLLLGPWKGYTPALRGQVLDVLLARPLWTRQLIQTLQQRQVPTSEIDTVRRQRLLQSRDDTVRRDAADLFAAASSPDRNQLVNDTWLKLPEAADVQRGAKVFARACATCHKLGDVGQAVGPDLASVGDKSPQGLLTAILDPNRAVEARYVNYLATTKTGLVFTGMLQTETSTSITIVGPDGKAHDLLRADLDELVSTGKSVMPEGLEKDLTPQDLADVIAFIRAQGPAPQAAPRTDPQVLRPDRTGALTLAARHAAIRGPSLVLEQQYGNLGYWHSPNDHAAWAIDLPRPATFAVRLDYACADDSAGNKLLVQAGPERLTFAVAGTGTWDTYRRAAVGRLRLPAGRTEVTARPAGPVRGAVLDLRAIEMTPVEK